MDACTESVHTFLTELWDEYDGYRGVEWNGDIDEEVMDNLMILAQYVQYARAPIQGDSPQREGLYRIANTMKRLARGRALLDRRESIEMKDLQVCARVALSTMHRERRPVVRALLDPDTGDYIDARTVMDRTGASRPTALSRLGLMDTLGLGTCQKEQIDGDRKKVVRPAVAWPDELDFPEF